MVRPGVLLERVLNMSIEELIEQVSDKEIAEALLQSDSVENDTAFDQSRRIIEAYGFNWRNTTSEDNREIFNDFLGRFARLVAMYSLSEIAETQQREKLAKVQLTQRITADILIWFAYAERMPEITTQSVISLAEKIAERVQNA